MRTAWSLIGGIGLRRAPVWIGMAAIVAMSWYYLGRMDSGPSAMHGGAAAHAGMTMRGDGAAGLLMALGMWAVMMMAMMLPTVAPSASVFSRLSARRDPARANGATATYVAGYAACWIAFAAPAALMQWALTHALLLDPMAGSTSAMLSSAILLAAGVYQWLPLKSACLSKCRTPLAFFMANWRDGQVRRLLGWSAARRLLRRLLLGPDDRHVRRRGDEPRLDGIHHASGPEREGDPGKLAI